MIITVRQFQKCGEQYPLMYIAFVDNNGCEIHWPDRPTLALRNRYSTMLLCMFVLWQVSFHEDMNSSLHIDFTSFGLFYVNIQKNHGPFFAPTLLGIFFSLLLLYAIRSAKDEIVLLTSPDGSLFDISHANLRPTKSVRNISFWRYSSGLRISDRASRTYQQPHSNYNGDRDKTSKDNLNTCQWCSLQTL